MGPGPGVLHGAVAVVVHGAAVIVLVLLGVLPERCKGDLAVDCHHTIEDVGIVLGGAIRQALGDKQGIARFGSCLLPMDETLALCAVDLGGRPYFVYDAAFAGQSCGGMDTQILCRQLRGGHEPAPESPLR